MDLSDFLHEILFVVVLYKRKPEQSPSFNTLMELARHTQTTLSILVYDNSPEPSTSYANNIIYRHDPSNSGTGKAYNEASALAADLDKKWMHLLDQDTATTVLYYHKLFDAVARNPHGAVFVPKLYDPDGFVSPFRWRWGGGERIDVTQATLPLQAYRFANSGLLVLRSTFREVDGYHPEIPLDFSDIAFGEKLKAQVDDFIIVDDSLRHDLSATSALPWHASLERFHFFCLGAFVMGREYGPFYVYFGRTFLRAVYLTLLYRRAGFIKTFFLHATQAPGA